MTSDEETMALLRSFYQKEYAEETRKFEEWCKLRITEPPPPYPGVVVRCQEVGEGFRHATIIAVAAHLVSRGPLDKETAAVLVTPAGGSSALVIYEGNYKMARDVVKAIGDALEKHQTSVYLPAAAIGSGIVGVI